MGLIRLLLSHCSCAGTAKREDGRSTGIGSTKPHSTRGKEVQMLADFKQDLRPNAFHSLRTKHQPCLKRQGQFVLEDCALNPEVVADLVVGPSCGAIVRDRMWGHLVGLPMWGCCGCQDLEVGRLLVKSTRNMPVQRTSRGGEAEY